MGVKLVAEASYLDMMFSGRTIGQMMCIQRPSNTQRTQRQQLNDDLENLHYEEGLDTIYNNNSNQLLGTHMLQRSLLFELVVSNFGMAIY